MSETRRLPKFAALLLQTAGDGAGDILDSTNIAAIDDTEAIEMANQWAAQRLIGLGVPYASLQVNRDGVEIRIIPIEVRS